MRRQQTWVDSHTLPRQLAVPIAEICGSPIQASAGPGTPRAHNVVAGNVRSRCPGKARSQALGDPWRVFRGLDDSTHTHKHAHGRHTDTVCVEHAPGSPGPPSSTVPESCPTRHGRRQALTCVCQAVCECVCARTTTKRKQAHLKDETTIKEKPRHDPRISGLTGF